MPTFPPTPMRPDGTFEPKEYPLPPPSHNIPRKPIPSTTTTNTTKPAHSPTTTTYKPPLTAPTTKTTLLSLLRTRWTLLRRRTRIILITLLLVLLALILGLSIGLTQSSKSQNLPLPSAHGGPYTGELTYYAPGLGACGITSSSSENIVAVSHLLYDAAQSGSDPNSNPLCGRKLRAKRVKEGEGERTVDLTVVDRCTGCKSTDIDVSLSVFKRLAREEDGRVGVSWSWLE